MGITLMSGRLAGTIHREESLRGNVHPVQAVAGKGERFRSPPVDSFTLRDRLATTLEKRSDPGMS